MARAPNTPRISINKLAEFMTANPTRQRKIIRDQKFPPTYQVVYYREAQDAIASCIASNMEDLSAVERQISILNQQSPGTVGAQRRLASNVDALEAFLDIVDDISLAGAVPRLGASDAPKLRMRNVEVSIRPEIILTSEARKGPIVGALKLHFPKTNRLDDRTSGYVSAALQEWSAAHLADEGTPDGSLCMVVDIGSRRHYGGVRATKTRLRELEDACSNIAAMWPSISQTD